MKAKVLILILFIALAGCATNPVTKRPELSFLSVQGELKLGREVVTRINKESLSQGPFITQGWVVDYLQSIVDRFMPYYERRGEMPAKVNIAPVAVPNAWSVPGYITVNLGLIPCLDNEAQLAFILGHELGHIAARHTAERYTQSVLLSLGVRGVGMYGGRLAALIGDVVASLYIASYSRSQERMADSLGFKYMSHAGYDPFQSAKAMENVEKCAKSYMKEVGLKEATGIAGFIQRIFADHPGTKERVQTLTAKAKAFGKHGVLGFGNFDKVKKWAKVRRDVLVAMDKAYFKLKNGEYKEANSLIKKALKKAHQERFEPRIMARLYAISAFMKLKEKKYKEAWEYALNATDYAKDYYVAYKIAGIAGLREGSKEGLEAAATAFEDCVEYKSTDPDYISISKTASIDRMCLEGAALANCKLGNKKCKYYCRYFYKEFGMYPPSIIRYCIF